MTQNLYPEPNSDRDRSRFKLHRDKVNAQKALLSISTESGSLAKTSESLLKVKLQEEIPSRDDWQREINQQDDSNLQQSKTGWQTRTIAALASAVVMLPVLAVGTATYYFGSQAIERQAILTRRANLTRKADLTGIAEAELTRQRQLLATLLIGTGTTALLAGILAAFWTNRIIGSTALPTNTDSQPKAEPSPKEPEPSCEQFIRYLSQSFEREKILAAAVEEARKALECDRVVVYSLHQNSYGKVIAEAVTSGWTKALGITIADPCFEARYIEKYRDGRVKTLDNIYEADITPCYLEQLEKLEVKANLVTPILHQEKLFGLLVAHQCSNPRVWQPEEIDLLTRLAEQVSFALDNTELLNSSKLLKQQLDTEVQWMGFFTDANRHIRQSLQQKDILDVAVEEVQRILDCDRVVVYSLNQNNYGVVVAESVAVGWTRALGITIKDPCFEARYLEKYEQGRVRALDNIYEAGMTSCYLEQLEKLEVKANLVTPIINQGKIFGLLVAHHCASPHAWQQHEIRWVKQIAVQVSFALDSSKLLAESSQLKEQSEIEVQWTQFLTDTTRHIRQSLQQKDLLDATVKEVRRVMQCDRVVVYSLNQNNYGVVIAESVAPGWTRALGITIKDPCFASKYLEQYRDGRVKALDNIYQADITPCYLEQLEKLEVKANLVTPIIQEDKLFGLLVAHYCSSPHVWQQHEIRWLTQIATQAGFALDSAKLLAESTQLKKQAEIEAQWTHFLTDATRYIRQSLQQKDVLNVTVKEVHRVLDCDRVVVYSLNQDKYGVVVAESVAVGWTRALGITIKDPCFEARYLEQYEQGRVRALDNIYEAGMTSCYLEQLEKLEVKANLVTPIINEGKIFGLLVAHYCSSPHAWQQHEIRWLTQIATQVGFTLDDLKILKRLEADNLPLQSLNNFASPNTDQLREAQGGAEITEEIPEKNALALANKMSDQQELTFHLLSDSKQAFKNLLSEATQQSKAIANLLEQTQIARDCAQDMTGSEEQLEESTPATFNENLFQNNLTKVQAIIAEVAEKVKQINRSSQKLAQIGSLIDNLSQEIKQQEIDETIKVDNSGESDRSSLVSIAERVAPLTNRLTQQTSQIETIIGEIAAEVADIVRLLKPNLDKLLTKTELEQETQTLFGLTTTINAKIGTLAGKIAQAIEQTQNLAVVNRFILQIAALASNAVQKL